MMNMKTVEWGRTFVFCLLFMIGMMYINNDGKSTQISQLKELNLLLKIKNALLESKTQRTYVIPSIPELELYNGPEVIGT